MKLKEKKFENQKKKIYNVSLNDNDTLQITNSRNQ